MPDLTFVPFATAEWLAALKDAINTNKTYAEVAKTWEGDFWFVVENEAAAPTFMYLDLWHGTCREAHVSQSESEHTPEFRITANLKTWQRVVNKEMDPIRALMTGHVKLKGNLAKVMRNVRAAQELVLCAASIPTAF